MTLTPRLNWKKVKSFVLIWVYTALILLATQLGFGLSVMFNSHAETDTTACLTAVETSSEQIDYSPGSGAELIVSDAKDKRCAERAVNLKLRYTGSLLKFMKLERTFHQDLKSRGIKVLSKSVQYQPDLSRSLLVAFFLTVIGSLGFLYYQRSTGRFISRQRMSASLKYTSIATSVCIVSMVLLVWLPFQLFGGYFHVPDYLIIDMDGLKPGLAAWVGIVVLAPICEEVIFRAWLLEAWQKIIGAPAALILTSIIFSVIHPMGLVANLIFIIPGLIFGALWLKTRSLTACVIAHGVYNAFSLTTLVLVTQYL